MKNRSIFRWLVGGDGSFSKRKLELAKISDYWVSKEDADCLVCKRKRTIWLNHGS